MYGVLKKVDYGNYNNNGDYYNRCYSVLFFRTILGGNYKCMKYIG